MKYPLSGPLACLVAAAVSFNAVAEDFALRFDTVFSGATPASLSGSWLDLWFEQAPSDTVRLTICNANLTGSESLDEVYINLNPVLDPALLTFSVAGGTGAFDLPLVSKGADLFKADGDGKYDVKLTFSAGGSAANRFTAGECLTYDISGIPGLTVSDFASLSLPSGGVGPFYAAAHIQRIGAGSLSGWIAPTGILALPVPEPSSVRLLPVAAILAVWRSRRAP